ncbi:MAG: transposase [Candidatus Heimdallarchaeota archaeon]
MIKQLLAEGLKVKGPNDLIADPKGRWFYCQHCGFSADRDYNATINIYRASFIDYKQSKSLKDTNPIPYMEIGIPSLNCS